MLHVQQGQPFWSLAEHSNSRCRPYAQAVGPFSDEQDTIETGRDAEQGDWLWVSFTSYVILLPSGQHSARPSRNDTTFEHQQSLGGVEATESPPHVDRRRSNMLDLFEPPPSSFPGDRPKTVQRIVLPVFSWQS